MPRSARFIAPGVAHHITQRGIDRQSVFHSRRDRLTYLSLLREQAAVSNLPILAYCLMANHMHLIAVPHDSRSDAASARPVRAVFERSPGSLWAPLAEPFQCMSVGRIAS
ncbi:transposase, partial [Paludibaculum fermentans]|uniref:transposase n=1 Tax=Paludibaculum fermentans TaxID=1473598 RepID=UPI003EBE7E75